MLTNTEVHYNVACLNGHVWVATAGSKLEARCKARAASGKLDAMPVHQDDCSECQEERQRRDQKTRYYLEFI